MKKILQGRYYLTQKNGQWFVININEQHLVTVLQRAYNWDGIFTGEQAVSNIKEVSRNGVAQFTDRSGVVQLVRPVKYSRTSFKFEGPENSLANQDYTDGVYIANETWRMPGYHILSNDFPSNIPITSYLISKYNLDGWTLKRVNTADGSTSPANISAFIRRYRYEGVEKFREIAFSAAPPADKGRYYIENNSPVPVEKGDRVRMSFEWRITNNATPPNNFGLAFLLLVGDSGKVYSLRGGASHLTGSNKNKWYDNPNRNNPQYPWLTDLYQTDRFLTVKNDWVAVNDGGGEYSDPVPEDGTIIVRLLHYPQDQPLGNAGESFQSIFRNIQFDVKKILRGECIASYRPIQ
ncbi:hypothetical protein LWM68_40985 [Niabella sp. W65]|nr:hypothetical protein [Niabella sp. W65]MCH7368549.1 hypothetical protein [Niabella sp. W65]ULT44138.1 hypothetical protein KRR40_12680 [Niabella sp. I65]